MKRIHSHGALGYTGTTVGQRVARRLRQAVLVVWAAAVIGALSLVVGAVVTDRQIAAHQGRAVATVMEVSRLRTIATFPGEDGRIHTPPGGLLYPKGLGPGQKVRIVYDTTNPDRAKVAGRGWRQTLGPAASAAAAATAAAAAAWALITAARRRWGKSSAKRH
ncbi:DUF3592 domain-containing protein [Corynebacterium mendelii]|uniref:DUF3592 domain-containing protein n=1 Tax=Corynebacterium mendelii TaxID=2765362 RepID=UPI0036441BE3